MFMHAYLMHAAVQDAEPKDSQLAADPAPETEAEGQILHEQDGERQAEDDGGLPSGDHDDVSDNDKDIDNDAEPALMETERTELGAQDEGAAAEHGAGQDNEGDDMPHADDDGDDDDELHADNDDDDDDDGGGGDDKGDNKGMANDGPPSKSSPHADRVNGMEVGEGGRERMLAHARQEEDGKEEEEVDPMSLPPSGTEVLFD
jgi:hypothetical protein